MLACLKNPDSNGEAARFARGSTSPCSIGALDDVSTTFFFFLSGSWSQASIASSRLRSASSFVAASKGPNFCFIRATFLPPAGESTCPYVRQR